MQVLKVEIETASIPKMFKSEEVNDALYKTGMDIADAADGPARAMLKGKAPITGRMFGCKTKKMPNCYMAIIYPMNRAAFAVQAKHNILQTIASKLGG